VQFNGDIRAVVFDLDDTLRSNHPHANQFFSEFVASMGIDLDQEIKHSAHRWAHRYWAHSQELVDDLEKHKGRDQDSFWENYTRMHLAALGATEADVELYWPVVHKHMRQRYKPESRLAPQTLDILDRLREKGYLVGILTNRSRPIYREMVKLELDLHLDFYLTAGQLGAFKPSKASFEQMSHFIGVAAEETIYVGDNYVADIEGAKSANLQPVLIDPLGLYPQSKVPVIAELEEIFSLLG
jgi:putative hydrolase of the HAD superfamily